MMHVIEAVAEGAAIHLRFHLDQPGVIGWQLFDPSTGAFLQEGEWSEVTGREADLRIPLPAEEGAYSVQVAPVNGSLPVHCDRRAGRGGEVGDRNAARADRRVRAPRAASATLFPRRFYCLPAAYGAIAS